MGKLNNLRVKSLGPGRHADGNGLHLLVKDSGARSWMLRIQADGKRRDLGLGSVDTASRTREQTEAAEKIPIAHRRVLTLAEARDKADAYRRMIKAGVDPIVERAKTAAAVPTFAEAARASCGARARDRVTPPGCFATEAALPFLLEPREADQRHDDDQRA